MNADSKKHEILVLCVSDFKSGAEWSLDELISSSSPSLSFTITQSKSATFELAKTCRSIHYLPYMWPCKPKSPIHVLKFFYSMLRSTIKLFLLVRKNNTQIIYANTTKSALYGLVLKLVTKKKLVCHTRDKVNYNMLKKYILSKSDAHISVSKYIHSQFPGGGANNHVIYGGINPQYWARTKQKSNPAGWPSNQIIVACAGQITQWKNQTDFIKMAKVLSAENQTIRFLIVGDDLSGREKAYKDELKKRIKELGLQNKIQFVGHREDMKEVMATVDILVHPAINEPFGRVIIEAMALEKPVVAYDCGGPREIIDNGETGFLVETKNYKALAKKVMNLVDNAGLREEMGKKGRKKVINKFGAKRYIKEMEKIFESLV